MSIALRYSSCHEKAGDITNDSFLKVFQNIQEFREEADFKFWLRRIVINTALDQFRKEKKFENQVPLELGNKEQINDSILGQLQADEILKMVQDLPENYRFTFNLFEIEGYSHEEIALKLGTTAATSRANLSRAKQMLRQMILILSEYERAI